MNQDDLNRQLRESARNAEIKAKSVEARQFRDEVRLRTGRRLSLRQSRALLEAHKAEQARQDENIQDKVMAALKAAMPAGVTAPGGMLGPARPIPVPTPEPRPIPKQPDQPRQRSDIASVNVPPASGEAEILKAGNQVVARTIKKEAYGIELEIEDDGTKRDTITIRFDPFPPEEDPEEGNEWILSGTWDGETPTLEWVQRPKSEVLEVTFCDKSGEVPVMVTRKFLVVEEAEEEP